MLWKRPKRSDEGPEHQCPDKINHVWTHIEVT